MICKHCGAWSESISIPFDERIETAKQIESLTAENARLRGIVDMIDALRADEGDTVAIHNDNPDFGGPNNVISVSWDFGKSVEHYITGTSLLDCLTKAIRYREARKAREAAEKAGTNSPSTTKGA